MIKRQKINQTKEISVFKSAHKKEMNIRDKSEMLFDETTYF